MADPKIRIRRSSTPNKVPNITQLELGELAINTYDGKIYLEQDQGAAGVGNTVVRINPWNVGLGTTAYNSNIVPQVSSSSEIVDMVAIFNDVVLAARGVQFLMQEQVVHGLL